MAGGFEITVARSVQAMATRDEPLKTLLLVNVLNPFCSHTQEHKLVTLQAEMLVVLGVDRYPQLGRLSYIERV